ncbi:MULTISPECIES: hypothetical protein [Pseudomonas]|uniref:Uncharacterized protein n=1 Tax=Pseudomonas sp. W17 TaxID=3144407 RepID=A0AAU7WNK2_9PSED|nr:hypothetical protein [Pseudomonas protegens]MCD9572181.1 hypothetical protein [Pseudomonas protegens]
MIGQPQQSPRDAIIDDLNRKLDQFFGSGGTVQEVAQGATGERFGFGATGHQGRLRAERARLAPAVREQADKGLNPTEIGTALSMRAQRVLMIATENNIEIRGRP